MATILVTHGIPAEGFSLLSGEKIVIPKPLMQFSTDELAALIPAADAVVACGALPGEIIRRGRKLRIIAGYGAGYDGVDVRAAAECGIPAGLQARLPRRCRGRYQKFQICADRALLHPVDGARLPGAGVLRGAAAGQRRRKAAKSG